MEAIDSYTVSVSPTLRAFSGRFIQSACSSIHQNSPSRIRTQAPSRIESPKRENLPVQYIGDRHLTVVTADRHILKYWAAACAIVGGAAGDAFSVGGVTNSL